MIWAFGKGQASLEGPHCRVVVGNLIVDTMPLALFPCLAKYVTLLACCDPREGCKKCATEAEVKLYHFFVLGEFRGFRAYRAIAGVVLCVTGAEALYADMGHFGAGLMQLGSKFH